MCCQCRQLSPWAIVLIPFLPGEQADLPHLRKLNQPCSSVSPVTPEKGQLTTRNANPFCCHDELKLPQASLTYYLTPERPFTI